MMNLVDVTNSYTRVITEELRTSSTHYIKVYTLGNSVVVHKKKADRHEIVISNKLRPITDKELKFVVSRLLGDKKDEASVSDAGNVVEIQAQID